MKIDLYVPLYRGDADTLVVPLTNDVAADSQMGLINTPYGTVLLDYYSWSPNGEDSFEDIPIKELDGFTMKRLQELFEHFDEHSAEQSDVS